MHVGRVRGLRGDLATKCGFGRGGSLSSTQRVQALLWKGENGEGASRGIALQRRMFEHNDPCVLWCLPDLMVCVSGLGVRSVTCDLPC